MNLEYLHLRSKYIQSVRGFFGERAYLEVDTPVLADRVIPEPTINLFETRISRTPGDKPMATYLLPSPELYMKRLVAEGSGSIFQLSRSFRNQEIPSRLHQPEFLMLEWYTVPADYLDSLETTETLLNEITDESIPSAARPPFRRMTVEEAFTTHAGIDLTGCQDTDALADAARRSGLTPGGDETWADIFHLVMLSLVEPKLPRDRPLALLDYPEQVRCLAKVKKGTPWRERWELYIDGVETANCFSELVDPAAVSTLFSSEAYGETGVAERTDPTFADIYSPRHPRCSGVALGMDRLIMVLTGSESIADIMPFPRS
jgi:elongation factor P--(R)-beta-lysine ligase